MRSIRLTILTLVLLAGTGVADAAPRSGTTSEGVRITLDGRTASMRVPARASRGARIEISCGMERPAKPAELPSRTVPAPAGRTVRALLPAAAEGAELCGFELERSRRSYSGAASLPPRRPSTPPVTPGPDVRQGATSDEDGSSERRFEVGNARFLLRGSVLTVRMDERFVRSGVMTLVCGRADVEDVSTVAFRNVVVGRGRRVVTGDIGPVRPDADFCLIEDAIQGGDVALALMGPPGEMPFTDRPPAPRPVLAAGSGSPPAKLQVQTLRPGRGERRSRDGDVLTVHYSGANWSDGMEFDSSWNRGEPFRFDLGSGQVIEGWDRGLRGMRPGERRRIVIPPSMAYGDQGSPPEIGPDETLIFVVDLVRITRR